MPNNEVNRTAQLLQTILFIFFILLLFTPLLILFGKSVWLEDGFSFRLYKEIWLEGDFLHAMKNSVVVSFHAAFVATILAFFLAYTMHFTNVPKRLKGLGHTIITLPMLLPTITYGFVLIYTFGNQGIVTKILDRPIFSIYGYDGLLIGYVLYTLPIVYILINNSMAYIDKRYLYVSHLMGDSIWRRTYHTIIHPMIGSIASAFILAFILSFTDFGIPASIGGEYNVVALLLYRTMLGSIVQFDKGAVIAMMMLIPAIITLFVMQYLKRFEMKAIEKAEADVVPSKLRDTFSGLILLFTIIAIILIFATVFIIPFTKSYPYDLTFTFDNVLSIIQDREFISILSNSIIVALITAVFGTLIAFISALIHVRTPLKHRHHFNWISMVTNAIPGMVLGIAYLFMFNGSSLKGTLLIIALSNIVHFFTTPFTMAKHALEKMDMSWEVTGALLQDNWLQTVGRVIIPNSKMTLFHMAHYYFVNAMVTVSGVIFLVGTHSALLSTWIKELQHFAKFNEIFILSLVILFINLFMNGLSRYVIRREEKVY